MDAAVRGHAASQTLVGECYLDGRGVEQDPERAEIWLYRAARQNNKRAQMLLRTR
jgi:TPR repeat protein